MNVGASPILIVGTPLQRIRLDLDSASLTELVGGLDPDKPLSRNLLSALGAGWVTDRRSGPSKVRWAVAEREGDDQHVRITLERRRPDGLERVCWDLEAMGDGIRVASELELPSAPGTLEEVTFRVGATQDMLVAMFTEGIEQTVGSAQAIFPATGTLKTFYTVDHDASLSLRGIQAEAVPVLVAQGYGEVALEFDFTGTYDACDEWSSHGEAVRQEALSSRRRFSVEFILDGNDAPFPAHVANGVCVGGARDVRTHLTAIYATQVGSVGSYRVRGSAYPTLAVPTRAYGPLHTFFDPDAWSLVNALSFSGDPYLIVQARGVLDRARSGITSEGLLPHHFDGEEPAYVSIAGTPQPGPNIFWCIALLDHVAATGDVDYLRRSWDSAVLPAVRWVLDLYDPDRQLLSCTGSLWVDVFRRDGYTFDTNAAAIQLLERVARAARGLGRDDEAVDFALRAADLRAGIQQLWREDHFATAISADGATVSDFIDSENFLAVAFGLTTDAQADALIRRLDAVPTMHPAGRGTWVSGRRYEEADCHAGNIGDSDTAMARLWWGDLLARQARGDDGTFRKMFEAVRQDLLDRTWMTERYDANGSMIRADGYHEYPGIVDMMLRQGICGLEIDVFDVTIDPMGDGPTLYKVGGVLLRHTAQAVDLRVPGSGVRTFRVKGLEPWSLYAVAESVLRSDSRGAVTFSGDAGAIHELRLVSSASESSST